MSGGLWFVIGAILGGAFGTFYVLLFQSLKMDDDGEKEDDGWIEVTEDTELEDHYFYLFAVTGYLTPIKGRFHDDCRHIELFIGAGAPNETYYFWEWKDKITHYHALPHLPIKSEKD